MHIRLDIKDRDENQKLFTEFQKWIIHLLVLDICRTKKAFRLHVMITHIANFLYKWTKLTEVREQSGGDKQQVLLVLTSSG
ncbi:MAG: hypothetical protein ACJ72X_09035 [Nitrososphaeraceae archaeon]|jgi:hypothetical protein